MLKPTLIVTYSVAAAYVLSGATQPLLMTAVAKAGLANPMCQLYMLFYYLGPATFALSLCGKEERVAIPTAKTLAITSAVAIFDILGQTLNYTGSTFAGPTIFAIVYSSVTVWTAVYSRLIISRYMNTYQWIGVYMVFFGLAITAFSSIALGPQVFTGACFVLVGSSIHALTYVLYEILLTTGEDKLSVNMNCSVQGIVACFVYLMWQIIYTRPHFTSLIAEPMQLANTTVLGGVLLLLSLSLSNFIHAFSYFHTLKYYPMGAVSAGVMKGFQAVLVFVFTSLVFCGRTGGNEMCFNRSKFVSLIVVVSGVLLYARATNKEKEQDSSGDINRDGYTPIVDDSLSLSDFTSL